MLHIVSWNVAGWKTASERIKKRHGSIKLWLESIKADVLCIQEVKISENEIELKGTELYGAKDCNGGKECNGGYDSFWSCPKTGNGATKVSSSSQSKGLNGVATFARKGLTAKACSTCLDIDELDKEGRCLMTDHGKFVIFNCYVPFSGKDYCRLPFKLRFLDALKVAMQKQRDQGKHVILVGDLNCTPRGVDCARSFRKIDVTQLLDAQPPFEEHIRKLYPSKSSQLKGLSYLREAWPVVEHALLNTLEVKEADTQNSQGKSQGAIKYTVIAQREDGRKVKLGKAGFSHPGNDFRIEDVTLEGCEDRILVREKDCLRVYELREAVKQLGPNPPHEYSMSAECWDCIADTYGRPAHNAHSVQWLHDILKDGMVDAFAEAHPKAVARYTCWDQSRNLRYQNEGSRIDHIIVSRGLWEMVGCVRGKLAYAAIDTTTNTVTTIDTATDAIASSSSNSNSSNNIFISSSSSSATSSSKSYSNSINGGNNDSNSDSYKGGDNDSNDGIVDCGRVEAERQSSLLACTGNGQFQGAATDGSGIPDAPDAAYQLQFQPAHTGMVYTPPEFSDHIGVSLLLGVREGDGTEEQKRATRDILAVGQTLQRDQATKATQPFIKQASITSYFGAAPCKVINMPSPTASGKRHDHRQKKVDQTDKNKRGKINSFFSKKL